MAIAISDALEKLFPNLPPPYPFHHFRIAEKNINELKQALPEGVRRHLEVVGDYHIIHMNAIEAQILQHANTRLNCFYRAEQIEEAISALYEDKKEGASFFGINLNADLILRIGPIVLFGLTFELWRRIRRIPVGRLQSEQVWFPLDTEDLIGRIAGYFLSVFPLVVTGVMYFTFAYAQGLGITIGSRTISLETIMNLELPSESEIGWAQRDFWAFVLLLFLPVHALMLIATSVHLLRIVNANAAPLDLQNTVGKLWRPRKK